MKKLMDAIKGMAVNYVVGILKEREDELAKHIASKIDIPFVSEKTEGKASPGLI